LWEDSLPVFAFRPWLSLRNKRAATLDWTSRAFRRE